MKNRKHFFFFFTGYKIILFFVLHPAIVQWNTSCKLTGHYSYLVLLSIYGIYCFSLGQIVLTPQSNVNVIYLYCLRRLVAEKIYENNFSFFM